MKETTRQFKDGEIIFREGDESLAMFVVRKGKVKLTKAASGNPKGGAITLATLAKGEMFGEMGILDGVPRNATAVAVGAVSVSVTPRHDFLDTLQRDPNMALKVMTKLVQRLRAADEKLAERIPVDIAPDPVNAPAPLVFSDAEDTSDKPGLFGRLFGRGKSENKSSSAVAGLHGPLRIVVAGFGDDLPPEAADTIDSLVSILSMIPNAVVKRVDDSVEWPAEVTDPEAARQTAARNAVQKLASRGCDVLIWGREEKIGRMLEVHATTAPTHHELRMGHMPPVAAVYVPFEEIQDPTPALLRAFVLATYVAESGRRTPELAAYLLADVVTSGSELPRQVKTFAAAEQASMTLAWANAAALCLGMDGTDEDMWTQTAQAYENAARRLPRTARDDWADVYIGLSLLEIARAERGLNQVRDGATQWDVPVEVLRLALESVRQELRPWDWALLNEKLGHVCYRQGSASGNDEQFKAALAYYQAATQIYTRADHPQKWAEIVSALAQVLQVYGDLLGSVPALERAVELLQATLEVRNQDAMPLLWAASQNNLGSALFLLAKRRGNTENYQESAEAFRKALTIYQVNGQGRLAAVTEKNLQRVEDASQSRSRRDERLPGWKQGET